MVFPSKESSTPTSSCALSRIEVPLKTSCPHFWCLLITIVLILVATPLPTTTAAINSGAIDTNEVHPTNEQDSGDVEDGRRPSDRVCAACRHKDTRDQEPGADLMPTSKETMHQFLIEEAKSMILKSLGLSAAPNISEVPESAFKLGALEKIEGDFQKKRLETEAREHQDENPETKTLYLSMTPVTNKRRITRSLLPVSDKFTARYRLFGAPELQNVDKFRLKKASLVLNVPKDSRFFKHISMKSVTTKVQSSINGMQNEDIQLTVTDYENLNGQSFNVSAPNGAMSTSFEDVTSLSVIMDITKLLYLRKIKKSIRPYGQYGANLFIGVGRKLKIHCINCELLNIPFESDSNSFLKIEMVSNKIPPDIGAVEHDQKHSSNFSNGENETSGIPSGKSATIIVQQAAIKYMSAETHFDRKKTASHNMGKGKGSKMYNRKLKINVKRAATCGGPKDLCCREPRRLSIQEFGWDDFVIHPKEFQLFVCSGSCGFDINKVHNLPYLVGNLTNPLAARPCCRAGKLSDLDFLVRINDKIEKRLIKNIVIDSCIC